MLSFRGVINIRESLFKKGLVVGILALFIVASVVPSISGNINQTILNLKKVGKDNECSSNTDWWPMFHHDLQSTGFSTSLGPSTKKVIWNIGDDWDTWAAPQRCSPVIVNDTVYIGACDPTLLININDIRPAHPLDKFLMTPFKNYNEKYNVLETTMLYEAYVFSFDANTGEELWRTILPDQFYIGGAPAVDNNKVYITSNYYTFSDEGEGFLFCLDANNGDILWNFSVYQRYISPLVDNGRVYLIGWEKEDFEVYNAKLYCLDALSGVEIYNTTLGDGKTVDAPAMYNDWIYVLFYDSVENVSLCCLDAINGDIIWCKDLDGNFHGGSPIIADDKVIVSSAFIYSEELVSGKLWCFDAETGDEIWSYYTEGLCNGWSTPAFAYGNVYVALTDHAFEIIDDGEIHCLDVSTGEVLWEKYLGYWLASSPAVADGKIYVNSMDWWGHDGFGLDGYTHCIDAFSGDIIWSYWLLGGVQTSPAIAEDGLYVAVQGYFFKIDDSAPDNNPPEIEISGETKVVPGVKYTYTIVVDDPEGSDVYVIYTTSDEPDGYYGYKCQSGEIEEIQRNWSEKINTIKVRAQDTNLAWSDWEVLEITMPKNKMMLYNPLLLRLLERFPILQRLLLLIE